MLDIVTLGPIRDAQMLDSIDENTEKRYMHQYNFPSYSVGETKPSRGPGRREIGHGALAERALVPVLPSIETFPYAVSYTHLDVYKRQIYNKQWFTVIFDISRIFQIWKQIIKMLFPFFWSSITLCYQNIIFLGNPCIRPMFVSPTDTKRQIQLSVLQISFYWLLQEHMPIKPIMIKAKPVNAIFLCRCLLYTSRCV